MYVCIFLSVCVCVCVCVCVYAHSKRYWHILYFSNNKSNNTSDDISLEAFAATEFNEIFSGRQPRQDLKVFGRFGN